MGLGGVIDASYDRILNGAPRIRAALNEAERVKELPREAWVATVDDAVFNKRHIVCGGLGNVMKDHVVATMDLAWRMSTGAVC